MRVRTQTPISHQHIPCLQARMDRLHLGKIAGEEGRDHELQEHPSARMEPPQEPRDGNAAPRPLLCWLAERVLEGRSIRHRAPRAIGEKRAMALPPPFVQGGSFHCAAETLQQEVKDAPRESGPGVTGGRRAEPQARQMGEMTAGGMAMQHLPEKALDGGDGREYTVAPGGLAGLLTRANECFWLPLGRPLWFKASKHGGDTGYHRSTSCTRGDHRPFHIGDTMVDQHRSHHYQLITYP
jgi:hypothetical protein